MSTIYRLFRQSPIIGPQIVRRNTPSYLISQRVTAPDAFVVQIGANDGATKNDPIFELMHRNPGWRGLFVEPVPYLFQRLVANYGSAPRFRFENAAINNGTPQTFYWVDEQARKDLPDIPSYFEGLGSFREDHITNHLPALRPYIRQTLLQGLTLTALFEKHKVAAISVLCVDTEGYDWQVLQQLDLARWQPTVILFEHKHLTPADFHAAIKFLQRHYKIHRLKSDCFCWQP